MDDAAAASRHVLVVEDEVATRLLLEVILVEAGYRVTLARDGVAALEAMAAAAARGGARFDALLTDLRMPRLDGIGLIRRLREDDPGVPVVVLTATADAEARAALQALGVPPEAVLAKPVDEALLCRVLRHVLAGGGGAGRRG